MRISSAFPCASSRLSLVRLHYCRFHIRSLKLRCRPSASPPRFARSTTRSRSRPISKPRPSPALKPSTSPSPSRQARITLNAHDLAFKSVKIEAAGKEQTATVSLDKDKATSHLHRSRKPSRRQRHADHRIHRHPERRAPRLLSLQDCPPQLRRHAVRIHRCAPRLSLLRRARLQGHLRHFARRRQRRHRHLQRPHRQRHARPRRRQAHAQVPHHAEDVHVSRGLPRRRLSVLLRRAGRRSHSHLLHARQSCSHHLRRRCRQVRAALLQHLLRHSLSAQEA